MTCRMCYYCNLPVWRCHRISCSPKTHRQQNQILKRKSVETHETKMWTLMLVFIHFFLSLSSPLPLFLFHTYSTYRLPGFSYRSLGNNCVRNDFFLLLWTCTSLPHGPSQQHSGSWRSTCKQKWTISDIKAAFGWTSHIQEQRSHPPDPCTYVSCIQLTQLSGCIQHTAPQRLQGIFLHTVLCHSASNQKTTLQWLAKIYWQHSRENQWALIINSFNQYTLAIIKNIFLSIPLYIHTLPSNFQMPCIMLLTLHTFKSISILSFVHKKGDSWRAKRFPYTYINVKGD